MNIKITKWFLVGICLLGIKASGLCQDINYSQYTYTPTLVNPGIVGGASDAQLIFNYRSQWRSLEQKITSPMFTGILPFITKENIRKGGIGLSLVSDKTGSDVYFQNTGALLNLAYNIGLSKKVNLSFGLGAGYFQRRLSEDGLTSGSQYVPNSGYDASRPLGENFSSFNANYFDFNGGVYLYAYDSINSRKRYYVGMSGYHLNQPDLGMAGVKERLPIRLQGFGGFMLINKTKYSISPEVYYSTNAIDQRVLGGVAFNYYFIDLKKKTAQNISVGFTPRYSLNDALILAFQINKQNLSIGFSYDATMSTMSEYTGYRGATEFMVLYRIPVRKNKVIVEDYSVGQVREIITKESNNLRREYEEEEEDTKGYTFHIKEVITFEFNDTTLSKDAKEQLIDIANLMKGSKRLKIKVIGHSDNQGTERANKKISEDRARVAADFLIDQGIAENRITIKGKGSSEPLVPNSTEANKAKNRRVEFEIYK